LARWRQESFFGLATVVICSLMLGAQSTPVPSETLTFNIAVRTPEFFMEDGSLPLVCRFKNKAKRNAAITLKDHDEYHGTLPYPTGLMARVVDESGTVVTRNDVTKDDWWSSYAVWSQFCVSSTASEECLMPGDTITLKPGEEVIRIVPLARVLQGNRQRPDGLRAGKYAVQLKLVLGERRSLLSNELAIEVRPKESEARK